MHYSAYTLGDPLHHPVKRKGRDIMVIIQLQYCNSVSTKGQYGGTLPFAKSQLQCKCCQLLMHYHNPPQRFATLAGSLGNEGKTDECTASYFHTLINLIHSTHYLIQTTAPYTNTCIHFSHTSLPCTPASHPACRA